MSDSKTVVVPVVREPVAKGSGETTKGPFGQKKKSFPNLILTEAVKAKIVELYAKGRTTKEIEKIVGVSNQAIYKKRQREHTFDIDCRDAARIADDMVERALWTRATGMTITRSKQTEDGQSYEITEQLPPDTQAASYWLSRRRVGKWGAAAQNQGPVQILNILSVDGTKKDEIKR
jgi:hypothetical protein